MPPSTQRGILWFWGPLLFNSFVHSSRRTISQLSLQVLQNQKYLILDPLLKTVQALCLLWCCKNLTFLHPCSPFHTDTGSGQAACTFLLPSCLQNPWKADMLQEGQCGTGGYLGAHRSTILAAFVYNHVAIWKRRHISKPGTKQGSQPTEHNTSRLHLFPSSMSTSLCSPEDALMLQPLARKALPNVPQLEEGQGCLWSCHLSSFLPLPHQPPLVT